MFGIRCEGRSHFHFMRSLIRKKKGRSLSLQAFHCLVFAWVKSFEVN
ncbi:hypothetical protein QUA43_28520 [Microcoleus sp. N9_B4]